MMGVVHVHTPNGVMGGHGWSPGVGLAGTMGVDSMLSFMMVSFPICHTLPVMRHENNGSMSFTIIRSMSS